MDLSQRQTQVQTLLLTQKLQQSLHLLQLSAPDLQSYLEEASLSNPMLEVELPPLGRGLSEVVDAEHFREDEIPIEQRERQLWSGGRSEDPPQDFTAYVSAAETYTEHLLSQLGQMKLLDPYTRALSEYLVGCLSSSGYLDCPLPELAQELRCPLFDLEQALFVVQSLEPTGTGARSLSECLLLQLAQGKQFTALNIDLVRRGLPKLAEGDYAGLSQELHASPAQVQAAADYIRTLNPIPSRGFRSESFTHYTVPEATLRWDGNALQIEMNRGAWPRVSVSRENSALLDGCDSKEVQTYLRRKLQDAKGLISNLDYRQDTLFRLLGEIARLQSGFFTKGEPMQPMTMSQVADDLGLNISTVSRAVKDKYIQYNGRIYSLRSLFSSALQSTDGAGVSADGARRQIRLCIEAEDPAHPLSDSALCSALAAMNIQLSRRTVAKYRGELGIPSAAQRRKG